MTYVLLLDRATLSQKNLWIDERGFVFVIFTICSLAEQLGRSTVSVSSALKELDELLPFGFGPSNVAGNKAVEE